MPKENLLGPIGQGVEMSPQTMIYEMNACGACALGLMEEAMDMTMAYVGSRMHKDGMPFPMRYDVMRVRLMENVADINFVRGATYAAALAYDAGQPNIVDSLLFKASCFKLAERVTSTCIDLEGGVGLSKSVGLERLYRDAKVGLIGGGQYDFIMSNTGAMRFMGIA